MRKLLGRFCVALALSGAVLDCAAAQQKSDADTSRGVRLLDPGLAPPPAMPEFSAAPPPLSSSSSVAPNAAGAVGPAAALPAAPAGTMAPQATDLNQADGSRPPTAALGGAGSLPDDQTALSPPAVVPGPPPSQADVAEAVRQLPNAAGLSLAISPSGTITVGERLTIRVVTKKPGYLILVDIDPAGRLTQIFPNPRSLLMTRRSPLTANEIRPGRTLSIPDPNNAFAGFQFVAMPPSGTALLVALLSNRPVQVLDLPDIPPALVGQAAALTYVRDMAARLKIAQLNGPLQEIDWSFDAKFYAVQ